MRRLGCALLTLAPLLLLSRPVSAQQRAISADMSIGYSYTGIDGTWKGGPGGISFDLLLAASVKTTGDGMLLFGVASGGQGPLDFGGSCTLTPDGGCLEHRPGFAGFTALIGWENARTSWRALTGPGYLWAGEAEVHSAFAWQARVDMAAPILPVFALLVSVRGTLVPEYLDETVGLFALGFGMRLRVPF